MSIEITEKALLKALSGYVTSLVTAIAPAIASGTAIDHKVDKADKAEKEAFLAGLKANAKDLAKKIVKDCGKGSLVELLDSLGAKTFKDIPDEIGSFQVFITKAQDALKDSDNGDDDLLDDSAATKPVVERTLEDVKKLLLKINNTKDLGRNVTKQILSNFGITRLNELKKESFGDAYSSAEAALHNAGLI